IDEGWKGRKGGIGRNDPLIRPLLPVQPFLPFQPSRTFLPRASYDGSSFSGVPMHMRVFVSAALFGVAVVAVPAGAQVTKETVPGVTNFARVETTVACGGAIKPEAVAELKQRGFRSIFDLQLPTEKTANVEGEAAAAKAAGVNFIHVPFTPSAPDTTSVDTFLAEIQKPDNEPAFIHCG